MKNIIKFIVFIIITISIFFIENLNLIGAIFLCNCINLELWLTVI